MADTDVELLDYEEEEDQDMLDAQQHQKVDEEMETDYDNNRKLTLTWSLSHDPMDLTSQQFPRASRGPAPRARTPSQSATTATP